MRIIPLVLVGLSGFALSACSTSPKKTADKSADAADYEKVTPVGSHVTQRVRKGQTGASASGPTQKMTGEQADDAVTRAGANAQRADDTK